MQINYEARYIPIFLQDVSNVISYITKELKNVQAANKLIDDLEKAINERLPVCESFEKYDSLIKRDTEYYRIYVANYIVYYVVIEEGNKKIMEMRRFLYKGQNRDAIINQKY